MGAGAAARGALGGHINGVARLGAASMPAVLMYHSVHPDPDDPYLVTVSPARFEQQIRWLRRRGLRGVSVSELLAARADGRGDGLVALTFDDGYADFVDYALPVLGRYGFGATLFALAGRLGEENSWDEKGPRKPLMTERQVRQAADAGIEIGSHGLRHVSLPGARDATLTAETENSRAVLQAASGQPVTGFCYPYGYLDGRVVDAVRAAGYSYGCAIWRSAHSGPHALPRIYVGNSDTPARLWAKGLRYWLTWCYRGPAAGAVASRVAGPDRGVPAAGPAGPPEAEAATFENSG